MLLLLLLLFLLLLSSLCRRGIDPETSPPRLSCSTVSLVLIDRGTSCNLPPCPSSSYVYFALDHLAPSLCLEKLESGPLFLEWTSCHSPSN